MPAAGGGAKATPLKAYPTIGACGLDCGLCPRYYTVGTSRCPGCAGPGFFDKHPSCSFITCCVKKRGLEVCGQCPEFPCPKFKGDEEYRRAPLSSSYPPDRKLLSNLRSIREKGIEAFAKQQGKRIALLESMIEGYDDGRSRSFFCRAAALLDPTVVEGSLDQAKKATAARRAGTRDAADKARVLRGLLVDAAVREGIELAAKR